MKKHLFLTNIQPQGNLSPTLPQSEISQKIHRNATASLSHQQTHQPPTCPKWLPDRQFKVLVMILDRLVVLPLGIRIGSWGVFGSDDAMTYILSDPGSNPTPTPPPKKQRNQETPNWNFNIYIYTYIPTSSKSGCCLKPKLDVVFLAPKKTSSLEAPSKEDLGVIVDVFLRDWLVKVGIS